jgi:hypothetical protein
VKQAIRTNIYKKPPRVILVVKAHTNTYVKSEIVFILWLHGKKARREERQKIKKGVARVCMGGGGEGGPLLFCAAGALLALKSPGISSYTRYTVYTLPCSWIPGSEYNFILGVSY